MLSSKKWLKLDCRFPPLSIHGLAPLFFIICAIVLFSKQFLIPQCRDPAWHILAGELIRKKGIPIHDTWSLHQQEQTWINLSWLWDIWISFLYDLSGDFYYPISFSILINALTFAGVVALAKARGGSTLTTAAVVSIGIVPFSHGMGIRPQQITFLCTLIFYWILYKNSQSENFKGLYLLPPLMLLWVNCHGGFLVGLLILAGFLAQELFVGKRPHLIKLASVLVLCVATTTINPVGVDVWEGINRTLSGPLQEIISEWQPLSFSVNQKIWGYLLYIYASGLILLLCTRKPQALLIEKLLFWCWFILVFKAERHMTIFFILSAPVFALLLGCVGSRLLKTDSWLRKKQEDYDCDLQKPPVVKGLCCACFVFTLLLFSGLPRLIFTYDGKDNDLPIEEIDYLVENHTGKRVLNDYFWGSCLLFRSNNKVKHFIDGRAETAFSKDIVSDYLLFHRCNPAWPKLISKYNIDAAIVRKNDAQEKCFTESVDWPLGYSGRLASVYIRAK